MVNSFEHMDKIKIIGLVIYEFMAIWKNMKDAIVLYKYWMEKCIGYSLLWFSVGYVLRKLESLIVFL